MFFACADAVANTATDAWDKVSGWSEDAWSKVRRAHAAWLQHLPHASAWHIHNACCTPHSAPQTKGFFVNAYEWTECKVRVAPSSAHGSAAALSCRRHAPLTAPADHER